MIDVSGYLKKKSAEITAGATKALTPVNNTTMQAGPAPAANPVYTPPESTTTPEQDQQNNAYTQSSAGNIPTIDRSSPNNPMNAGTDPSGYKTPTSVSGENLRTYNEGLSANLGKDPGYTTAMGADYAQRVADSLKGPDASSVNVQNTADTNASRRQYMGNLQAGEAIGQSGFGPGSAQAERIRMNAQSGVNSANQAGQNSANEYLRQRTEQNMNRANNLENQQYGRAQTNIGQVAGQELKQYGQSETATDRGLAAAATAYSHGRDQVGDTMANRIQTNAETQQGIQNAQWDKLNTQQQQQLSFENAQVLKGTDETAKRNLINSLPEGPAKNAANLALNSGKSASEVAATVFNPDGTLKITGETPAALGLKAEMETAGQQAELEGLSPGTQAYIDRQKSIVLAGRAAKSNPITDATKAAETKTAKETLIAKPETLDEKSVNLLIESGDIPKLTEASSAQLSKLQPGDMAKVGDTLYKVESQGKARTWGGDYAHDATHTNYTVLTDSTGTKKIYNYDGANHDAPPKEVPLATTGHGFTPFW